MARKLRQIWVGRPYVNKKEMLNISLAMRYPLAARIAVGDEEAIAELVQHLTTAVEIYEAKRNEISSDR